jgi:hypothetical protein
MTEYEVGDKVLVEGTVTKVNPGYAIGVELFSPTDQYMAWVRPDLVKEPGTVTLSKDDAACCLVALRKARVPEQSVTARLRITTVIDRIDKQVNPRIEEPGLYGVVKAKIGEGGLWTLVRSEEGWICLEDGAKWEWESLVNPTEIRAGQED